jgi:hypothetical protein
MHRTTYTAKEHEMRKHCLAGVTVLLALALSACSREPPTAGSPPQMRRLTEVQYRQSIADVFGSDIKVVGRFEPDMRIEGLLAVGTSAVSITPTGLEQYEAIAREIARQVVDEAHRERLVGCAPGEGDPDGVTCARGFFARTGERLFRRPLTEDELARATDDMLKGSQRLKGFHDGLAAALTGMLTAPDFLFRVDSVADSGELDGYSKAVRLSYFLWNAAPDDTLLAAATRGDLDSGEGRAREVERLLASPRFADGVRAFFDDFLQLEGLAALSKDSLIYPAFSPAITLAAREQTLRTITDLLLTRDGDYRDLFTTRRMAIDRTLGPVYDVPVPDKDWTTIEFAENDPRAGLLTQVSFLALHSHPGRTSPTLRGKALREIVMCQKIPTPPANVNFTIVQDVTNPELKTTRARVEAHLSDPECASCHKLTDPMGLAMEHFDGLGQYRADENGAAIETVGSLGENTFADAAELGKVLSRDPAVTSCLVRSVYRYATGQNVEREQHDYLTWLEKRFAADGYRLPKLMRTIATSDAFYAINIAGEST